MGWNYGKEAGVAAEREACAKVCEKLGEEYNNEINKKLCIGDELQDVANDCAESIRARGQE
jgi:histidinol phosphatase-like enzyme